MLLDKSDVIFSLFSCFAWKSLNIFECHCESCFFPFTIVYFQSAFTHFDAILYILPVKIDGLSKSDYHVLVFDHNAICFENTTISQRTVFLIHVFHCVGSRIGMITIRNDVGEDCSSLFDEIFDFLKFFGSVELWTAKYSNFGVEGLLILIDYLNILLSLSYLDCHDIQTVTPHPLIILFILFLTLLTFFTLLTLLTLLAIFLFFIHFFCFWLDQLLILPQTLIFQSMTAELSLIGLTVPPLLHQIFCVLHSVADHSFFPFLICFLIIWPFACKVEVNCLGLLHLNLMQNLPLAMQHVRQHSGFACIGGFFKLFLFLQSGTILVRIDNGGSGGFQLGALLLFIEIFLDEEWWRRGGEELLGPLESLLQKCAQFHVVAGM